MIVQPEKHHVKEVILYEFLPVSPETMPETNWLHDLKLALEQAQAKGAAALTNA